jgi:D-alanine-D-alanine ligase
MRVVVLHNAVSEQDSLEDQDVLVQAQVVAAALRQLGHDALPVPCTLDLAAMRDAVRQARPDAVFNLVESLDGADSLSYLAPAVLDAMGVPYTGNPTEATFLTTHKPLAKQRMHQAGLPTPQWLAISSGRFLAADSENASDRKNSDSESSDSGNRVPPFLRESAGMREAAEGVAESFHSDSRWIIKGVWEQASRNLDEEAIVTVGDAEELRRRLRDQTARLGRPCFAERFIAGREFNLSILSGRMTITRRSPSGSGTGDENALCEPPQPQVLPPAEIDFSAFPPGKPRIVGYRAKWEVGTFEFQNTPRRFDFAEDEEPLLRRLQAVARDCWNLFGLRGYVRVDFRVDPAGQPWILEVNTNPCLSPDAGFAAALGQANIPFEEAIDRILDAALGGRAE